MDPREEAFDALEAVQRECMVYIADHSESQLSESLGVCACACSGLLAGDEHVWHHALVHVLGSKDWWDAHYRETTGDEGATSLCSEVMQRTLGAYAAITFTAVAEMQRQQVEQRLFGEVTRPREDSPAWVALAAIGQEVRSAVRDGRCPDDTEAFNAWSVVSFYVTCTRGVVSGAANPASARRLRLRDFVVFAPPTRAGRAVDPTPSNGDGPVPDRSEPAADFVGGRIGGGFWMWARRSLRLRGA